MTEKNWGDLIESFDDIPAGTKIKFHNQVYLVTGHWWANKTTLKIVVETTHYHPKVGIKKFKDYLDLNMLLKLNATIA